MAVNYIIIHVVGRPVRTREITYHLMDLSTQQGIAFLILSDAEEPSLALYIAFQFQNNTEERTKESNKVIDLWV